MQRLFSEVILSMSTNNITAIVLAMLAAGVTGALLAAYWSTPRLSPLKGALIGPIAAGPTALLLQGLGGGLIGFDDYGMIDWTPVASTLLVGGACGLIVVGSLGLIRMGSRRPFG